jgi:hypothetical protein
LQSRALRLGDDFLPAGANELTDGRHAGLYSLTQH